MVVEMIIPHSTGRKVVCIVGCPTCKLLCDSVRGIWSYGSLHWEIGKAEHFTLINMVKLPYVHFSFQFYSIADFSKFENPRPDVKLD